MSSMRIARVQIAKLKLDLDGRRIKFARPGVGQP